VFSLYTKRPLAARRRTTPNGGSGVRWILRQRSALQQSTRGRFTSSTQIEEIGNYKMLSLVQ